MVRGLQCDPVVDTGKAQRVRRERQALHVFVGALALLVVNDHVLKGSGALPGWMTGKLSDLAGLVVAPALAVWVLRPRSRGMRALVFALPVVPFALSNLLPGVARGLEQVMAFAHWRIWSDPSDLIALVVLPLAWRVATHRPELRVPRLVTRSALVVAALACVATSAPGDPFYNASAVLVNHTGEAVDVRVRHLGEVSLDCTAIGEGEAALALAPELFTEAVTYTIEVDAVTPLDAITDTRIDATCRAAIVEVDGLEPQLLFWRGAQQWTDTSFPEGGWLPDHAVRLTLDDTGRPVLTPRSASVEQMPTLDRIDEARCPHAADALQWSGDMSGSVTLAEVALAAGGCTRLVAEVGTSLHVCAPSWALPFEAGDRLSVTRISNQLHLWADHAQLTITHRLEAAETWATMLPATSESECLADRTSCGAYVRTEPWQAAPGMEPLYPGQSAELPAESWETERTTALLGVSERVIVGHGACAPGRRVGGLYQETLLLIESVEEGLE